MSDTIKDIYAEVIQAVKELRTGKLDIETAKAMFAGANAAANLFNAEINFIKVTGGLGSGFIPEDDGDFRKDLPDYSENGKQLIGKRICSFCEAYEVIWNAPSINNLVACSSCLKSKSTLSFRRQLKLQESVKQLPKPVNLSQVQKDIIDFLQKRGGQSQVGVVGNCRRDTILSLESLEKKGLIENVERPVKAKISSPEQLGKSVDNSLHCGVWRLIV